MLTGLQVISAAAGRRMEFKANFLKIGGRYSINIGLKIVCVLGCQRKSVSNWEFRWLWEWYRDRIQKRKQKREKGQRKRSCGCEVHNWVRTTRSSADGPAWYLVSGTRASLGLAQRQMERTVGISNLGSSGLWSIFFFFFLKRQGLTLCCPGWIRTTRPKAILLCKPPE